MTANIATPQPVNLAARAARSVADTQTPVYNRLMTMIDATAVENQYVSQDQAPTGVLRIAAPGEHNLRWAESTSGWVTPRWSIGHLLTCAAGAVAAVAVVGAVVGAAGGIRQQPVAAADSSSGQTPLMVASTAAVDKPMERAAPTPKAEALAATGSKGEEATESAKETVAVPSAKSETPPDVEPAAGRPESVSPVARSESPSAEVETTEVKTVSVKIVGVTPATVDVDDVADPPLPKKVTGADTVASVELPPVKQPRPAVKAVSQPPRIETGSIVVTQGTGKAPDTLRIGKIASAVRMRAGPGNSEAVLGTLPSGAEVGVVSCRAWCEVVFNGQRGWIYKSFLAAPR